jgi:Zn-dependent M28 family amino/carboxypeptidase
MQMATKHTTLFCCLLLLTVIARAQDTSLEKSINSNGLKEIVQILSADSMMGRMTGSEGAFKAGNWITQQFMFAGLAPVAGNNGYWQPFYTNTVPILVGYNIVAALPGKTKSNEIVIFCAHYDHVGTQNSPVYKKYHPARHSQNKDSIFNGANDNASGVAALISLAGYFSTVKNNERTLLFVAFSGEELGLTGSAYFAKELDASTTVAVINLEMLGRGNNSSRNAYITGSKKSNLLDLMNSQLKKTNNKQYKNGYFKHDAYEESNLFERSDNYSFALKGIPAHTIINSQPEDIYYHTVKDEYNTLNYTLMATTVKAIALAVSGLVNGTDTPSRIKN